MTEISAWKDSIVRLAQRAGCAETVLPALAKLESEAADVAAVAIIGAPNSGKSSVLNAVLGRPLLVVTPLPSGAEVRVAATSNDASETLAVDGNATPLETPFAVPDASTVSFEIDDEWLRTQRMWFVEKRALDATEEGAPAAIDAALDGADVALLVIDATMPVRRVEPALLAEADRRGLPVAIVITKCDLLAGDDERRSVRDYVRRYVDLAAPDAGIVDLDGLRESLQTSVAALDFEQSHARGSRHTLQRLAQSVAAAATAARDVSLKSRDEILEDVRRRRQELDVQALAWSDLALELERRRQRITDDLRSCVEAQRPSLLEALHHDVAKSDDVRAWWQEDLPFVLQRELRYGSTVVAHQVNRAITVDVRWLHEQVRRRFALEPVGASPEPYVAPLVGVGVRRPELPLSDRNKLRTILGVSATAALVLAGRYLDRARVPVVSLALAVIGLPVTDEILGRTSQKDREQVVGQLDRVVAQADSDYVASVAAKLKLMYAEMLQRLRARLDESRSAQLDGIRHVAEAATTPTTNWDSLVQEANVLAERIGGDPS